MEVVPEHVNLGLIMRETLLEYRTSNDKAYFVMIFQNSDILCPTFALISPGATFKVAKVQAHVLQPLNPTFQHDNSCRSKKYFWKRAQLDCTWKYKRNENN